MKYARIVNAEYNSEDDLITFIAKWEKWCPDNMPPAASRHLVKTGPTSTLLMAVYETEEIAQTAGALVQSFFKDVAHHVHDMIAFDGEVLVCA